MADYKELFNQQLKAALGNLDRIALGIPGMEGCDNMLVSRLIEIITEAIQGNVDSSGGLNINESRVGSQIVTVGNNTVQFKDILGNSLPFSIVVDDDYILIPDFNGLGGEIVSQSRTGFVCNMLASGTIKYHAISLMTADNAEVINANEQSINVAFSVSDCVNGNIINLLAAPGTDKYYAINAFSIYFESGTAYSGAGTHELFIGTRSIMVLENSDIFMDQTTIGFRRYTIYDVSASNYDLTNKGVTFDFAPSTGGTGKTGWIELDYKIKTKP
jgi:hypothetical protein